MHVALIGYYYWILGSILIIFKTFDGLLIVHFINEIIII